jgi:hypothetical protein
MSRYDVHPPFFLRALLDAARAGNFVDARARRRLNSARFALGNCVVSFILAKVFKSPSSGRVLVGLT